MAILVSILASILTFTVQKVLSNEDNRIKDCQEQIEYFRDELARMKENEENSRRELEEYLRTILFQKAQINRQADLVGAQTSRLDSLSKKKEQ